MVETDYNLLHLVVCPCTNRFKMENINLIEDPDDAIIINEMSGLTIDEHEVHNCPKAKDIKVDRTDNGFQEKSEDISSDDGNEDPAGNA